MRLLQGATPAGGEGGFCFPDGVVELAGVVVAVGVLGVRLKDVVALEGPENGITIQRYRPLDRDGLQEPTWDPSGQARWSKLE